MRRSFDGLTSLFLKQVSDEFEGVVVLVKCLHEGSPLLGKVELGDEVIGVNGAAVKHLSDAFAFFQSTAGVERTIKLRRRI